MKTSLKKLNGALVLVLGLVLLLAQLPSGYSAESDKPENVLLFLEDVAGLDMTKYDVELVSVYNVSSSADAPDEIGVKYTLTFGGSKIDVISHLRNGAVVWCKLRPIEGSPLLAQSFTNALDESKDFLANYQTYSRASHIQQMSDSLDTINELTPTTKEVNDVRMEISVAEEVQQIKWMNTVNGVTNTYNVVTLRFRNCALELFVDNWNRYKIGSTEVNVDKEEAIHIAKEAAQKRIQEDAGDEAANFTFVYESAALTMQTNKNGMLQPHWQVHLTLNKMVLGYGAAFRVSVWADTGEIPYMTYSGGYAGSPQTEENPETADGNEQNQTQPSSSSALTSSENSVDPPASVYIIAASTATIAVAIIAVAIKKRNK